LSTVGIGQARHHHATAALVSENATGTEAMKNTTGKVEARTPKRPRRRITAAPDGRP
jgi:hypothetical protein